MRPWSLWSLCLVSLLACRQEPRPDPKALAEGHYMQGTAKYLQGHFDAALEAFAQVRALSPDDPRLPAAEGEAHLGAGRLSEALARFEEAARLDPKRGITWGRIGYILEQLGRRDEAHEALEKALVLHPGDYQAMESLARLERRAGRVDAAVALYLRAAQAGPEGARAELTLVAAGLLIAAERHADAQLLLGEAVGRGVVSGALARELGDLQVRSGALREALKSYQLAARLSPRDPTPWELVGELHAHFDRPADAEAAFRESLRVKNRAAVHLSLVRLHLKREDRGGAEASLAAALEAFDGSVPEALALAEALDLLGRGGEGLQLRSRLASEPGQEGNAELQRSLAAAARALKREDVVREACARLAAATDGGTGEPCP